MVVASQPTAQKMEWYAGTQNGTYCAKKKRLDVHDTKKKLIRTISKAL
jgi:hypothetical protein